MIPDDAVEVPGPVCISTIHKTDVPATVRGTWLAYQNLQETPGVWYCETCAVTAEDYGLYARDEEEVEL